MEKEIQQNKMCVEEMDSSRKVSNSKEKDFLTYDESKNEILVNVSERYRKKYPDEVISTPKQAIEKILEEHIEKIKNIQQENFKKTINDIFEKHYKEMEKENEK